MKEIQWLPLRRTNHSRFWKMVCLAERNTVSHVVNGLNLACMGECALICSVSSSWKFFLVKGIVAENTMHTIWPFLCLFAKWIHTAVTDVMFTRIVLDRWPIPSLLSGISIEKAKAYWSFLVMYTFSGKYLLHNCTSTQLYVASLQSLISE